MKENTEWDFTWPFPVQYGSSPRSVASSGYGTSLAVNTPHQGPSGTRRGAPQSLQGEVLAMPPPASPTASPQPVLAAARPAGVSVPTAAPTTLTA